MKMFEHISWVESFTSHNTQLMRPQTHNAPQRWYPSALYVQYCVHPTEENHFRRALFKRWRYTPKLNVSLQLLHQFALTFNTLILHTISANKVFFFVSLFIRCRRPDTYFDKSESNKRCVKASLRPDRSPQSFFSTRCFLWPIEWKRQHAPYQRGPKTFKRYYSVLSRNQITPIAWSPIPS